MKNILAITLLMLSMAASAEVKVIYGEDNRIDLFEETDPVFLELARSTAAMISNNKLERINEFETKLVAKPLTSQGICEEERFAKQPTAASCSGFLVGKNTLVTAGHCIKTMSDCRNKSWVFDYKVEYSEQEEVTVESSQVYKCKTIISRSLDSSNSNDYAYIELEREVLDREPLTFRETGKPEVGDKLVVIGHPSGLPTKVAAGAQIRSINKVYFSANLDTYGGNSGSAVFNADTGVVEGILVRGERDYVYNASKGCAVSNVVADDAGRGEDVTLITMVGKLIPGNDTGGYSDDGNDDDNDTGNDDEEESWWVRFIRWLLGEDKANLNA